MMLRRPVPESGSRDDAGFTLAEVMVTMGIMSVLMVLFTGAILQVYRTTTATEALSDAQSQLGRAFQSFDRQLRYASWIGKPGTVGTGTAAVTYVEFAGPIVTDCYQLRLEPAASGKTDDGILQMLTWKAGSPPTKGTRGRTLASEIVTADVPAFFERQQVNDQPYASPTPSSGAVGTSFTTVFQRLRIRLTTRVPAGTAQIDTTFTALNTSGVAKDATNACSEGRPT